MPTPLKNCLCEPISDGAPKSQHRWIQGHKGHSHILFFGKSPNYTLDAKNRSSLIRTSPWPDSRGGSPRRDPYCSTTFIMKETLAVAAQQISILKDWIEFDSAGRNFSPSISSYGWSASSIRVFHPSVTIFNWAIRVFHPSITIFSPSLGSYGWTFLTDGRTLTAEQMTPAIMIYDNSTSCTYLGLCR